MSELSYTFPIFEQSQIFYIFLTQISSYKAPLTESFDHFDHIILLVATPAIY